MSGIPYSRLLNREHLKLALTEACCEAAKVTNSAEADDWLEGVDETLGWKPGKARSVLKDPIRLDDVADILWTLGVVAEVSIRFYDHDAHSHDEASKGEFA